MEFRQKLAKATGIKESMLPAGYQTVGNVLLLKLPRIKSAKHKEKIAASALSILPYIKTVCEMKEVKGELREPVVRLIAGKSTVTIHKENDVLYKLDLSQVMFSKGNLNERKRIISQVKEGELIVDMFAGIGYFSLGLAKFTSAKEIISIERNPVAYNLLTDNIAINKISNVNAINGDCRQFAANFSGMADRVVMGYFPDTDQFLPFALHMARSGCVIHFHNIYKTKELWKKPMEEIRSACEKAKMKHEIVAKKKVKSYSPNTWHVVVDFRVTR